MHPSADESRASGESGDVANGTGGGGFLPLNVQGCKAKELVRADYLAHAQADIEFRGRSADAKKTPFYTFISGFGGCHSHRARKLFCVADCDRMVARRGPIDPPSMATAVFLHLTLLAGPRTAQTARVAW